MWRNGSVWSSYSLEVDFQTEVASSSLVIVDDQFCRIPALVARCKHFAPSPLFFLPNIDPAVHRPWHLRHVDCVMYAEVNNPAPGTGVWKLSTRLDCTVCAPLRRTYEDVMILHGARRASGESTGEGLVVFASDQAVVAICDQHPAIDYAAYAP